MPSARTIDVDAGDNAVAVLELDASVACAPPASLANDEGAKQNLSQALAEADDAAEEEGEDGGALSPVPQRSMAVITPKTSAKKAKTKGKKKAGAKGKGGDPATPPLPAASGAAVATPGEDSAKKDKGKGKKAKKPSVTLHSFFGKAGPGAKKAGGAKPKASTGKPTASSSASSAAAVQAGATGTGPGANATESSAPKEKEGGAPKGAPKTKKAPAKAKAGAKGSKSDNDVAALPPKKQTKKQSKKATAKPASASSARDGSTAKAPPSPEAEELDTTPTYALQEAMRAMSQKKKKRRGSKGTKKAAPAASIATAEAGDDASKENDGAGALAEVMVQETSVDAKAAADGDVDSKEDEAAEVVEEKSAEKEDSLDAVDAMMGVEEKTVDEMLALEDGAVAMEDAAAPSEENPVQVDEGSATAEEPSTVVLEETANAEESGDAMDVEAPEAGEESASAKDNADAQVDSVEIEEAASVSGANKDGDDDSDGTVSLDDAAEDTTGIASDSRSKQASDVPGEVTAEPRKEEPTEDEEVVEVDVPEKSAPEELPDEKGEESLADEEVAAINAEKLPAEDNAEEAPEEEVVVVEAPPAPSSKSPSAKKQSDKTTPKPRKKAPKKKATPQKVKGVSPIAASLKKMAALPPKKSTPAKKPAVNDTTATPGKSAEKAVVTAAGAKLSEENASRLRHYSALREKYVARALEVATRPDSDDFVEESLSLEGAADLPALEKGSVEVGEEGFPDALLTHLLLIVQGRSLPLSELAKQALEQLSVYTTDARPLTIESISSKIKLLAQRKSYLSGTPPAPSAKSTPVSKLDCFENAEECYMWRWELSSIDLIPQKEAAKAKKARTLRKKLQGHHKAIFNLIAAVDKATAWLQNTSKSTPAAGEKLIAKVSDMEEKVLKFEREEEKARLLKEAKLQKERSKAEGQAAKEAEKQRKKEQLEEERRNEKKRKEEEKAQKKLEAAKAREEAKRKKVEEKERKKKQEELKKQQELEEKENKRKAQSAYMMSFFSKGSATKKQKVASSPSPKKAVQADASSFDSDAFRTQINSQDQHVLKNPFAKHSKQSRESRRRKTGKVRVTVFVTTVSENAFAPQAYDEERVITVPNRYKFLGFHEDVRPPYRGTWSKTSSIINGRNQKAMDTKYLDYDEESEAEWEEGDDEEGEDLQDGDDGDEEDDMQEDDNDGWLAAEDDLGIEDEDEDDETRELRKRKSSAASAKPSHFKACVVAPRMGGLAHADLAGDDATRCVIEGFNTPSDAMDVLNSYVGCVVTPDTSICLDLFPPADPAKETQSKKDGPTGAQKKEMTEDAQRIMAVFVHNSTHSSKEIVVTELLKAHPTITNSRAQAVRELDSIAEKRRRNGGGALWEVKADHLKKLGLTKKDLKKAPKEPSPQKAAAKSPKGKEKKKKDPNAPKRNLSAYILYTTDGTIRDGVKAANPEAKPGDLTKLLAEKYKALTSEERAPWDAKAAADKERYQKEMAEYSAKNAAASSSDATAASAPAKSPKSAGKAKKSPGKKRKPEVSQASADLFASFLGVKPKAKKQKTETSE